MPLINTSVPNLIQGVSQQPDATRFAGQCEEQENALSSVAEGLKKRPNTRHVARLLQTAIDEDSFVHFIDRDDDEKYVVIYSFNGGIGTLQAWNILTGVECEINGSTGGYIAAPYLVTSNPRDVLKALTIADNTFMVNTNTHVRYNRDKTEPLEDKGFVYIAQGDYQKEYEVFVGNGTSLTVPPTISVTAGAFFSEGKYFFRVINVTSSGTIRPNGYKLPTTTTDRVNIDFDWGTLAPSIIRLPEIRAIYEPDPSSGGTIRVASYQIIDGGQFGEQPTSVPETDLIFANHGASINASIDVVSVPTSEAYGNVESVNSTDARSADTGRLAHALYDETDIVNSNLFAGAGLTNGTLSINYFNPSHENYSFDAEHHGNSIVITGVGTNDNEMSLRVSDGLAGAGIKKVHKEVDSITSLPLSAPDGFKVEVIGDAELSQDNYWVQFISTTGKKFGEGTWHETVAPDTYKGFDNSTMPLTLKNIGKNSFEIETISYAERTAGDLISNPQPSFVGKRIRNLTFFKNRLGIITDDSIVFSEAGNFFNFFRTTVTSLLDSDPIDVNVSHSRVTSLRSSAVFQEDLLLFADNAQFALKGGELLTPKTVSVSPVTSYNMNEGVDPLTLGSYIYFPFKRGAYSGLQEFSQSGNTETYDALEVTEHTPSYIPKNIIEIKGTTSESTIAVRSTEDDQTIYIYNYFWNNNQKVLSAWSKFTFTGEIRGMEFIDSTLHAIVTSNGETNLVEMPLESGLTDPAGYVTHLDMRVEDTVSNGGNTITLPYTPADNSVEVYTKDGLKLNCTNSGSTVTLTQAVTEDTDVWVGIPYTMKYTFSEQLFKAKAGNGTSPSNAAKLMIRNGSLYYDDTAYFKVKVTPKARDTYENVFTPDVIGASTIGDLSLDSGFYRFPVFTKAQDTTITIENESALPSTFQSAEFESFVHSRSKRYG